MQHDFSNRKSLRYLCNFDGYLHVLCPEVTFTPKPFLIHAADLSESGCRMMTRAVSTDLYRSLLREIRPVKIELDLRDGRILMLRGKLVWIDFREHSPTTLAITFNSLESDAQQELKGLLEDLNRKGAITVAESLRPDNPSIEMTP